MKCVFNASDAVDIQGFNSRTTVGDFFDAIDAFSLAHPLPCRVCEKNCCDGRFFIEMDCISARRLSAGNLPDYISHALSVVYPPNEAIQILLARRDERCRYLDASGACTVYPNRPASCRSYTCRPRSRHYDILDSVIAAALQHALIAEHFEFLIDREQGTGELSTLLQAPLAWLRTSPAYKKKGYREIRVKDCIRFDMQGNDLSEDDRADYAGLLAMDAL